MDPLSTCSLFEHFLAERRYLQNVTPSAIEWYETAFKALQKSLGADVPPLTKAALQQFVMRLRERGVKPVSCNTGIKRERLLPLDAPGGTSCRAPPTAVVEGRTSGGSVAERPDDAGAAVAEAKAIRRLAVGRHRVSRARWQFRIEEMLILRRCHPGTAEERHGTYVLPKRFEASQKINAHLNERRDATF